MACLQRYAEAFDYAVLWMCEHVDAGLASAGSGAALLVALTEDFVRGGVTVGMPVYNVTTRTYGKVLTVAATQLVTTNNWAPGDYWQLASIGADAVATIETFLSIAAGDINAARSSVGGCACDVGNEMDAWLRKLNTVSAAILHNCPCARPNLTDEMRFQFMGWVNDSLKAIRTGEIELCSGHTGSAVPAIAFAQMSWTDWRAAEIAVDRMLGTP